MGTCECDEKKTEEASDAPPQPHDGSSMHSLAACSDCIGTPARPGHMLGLARNGTGGAAGDERHRDKSDWSTSAPRNAFEGVNATSTASQGKTAFVPNLKAIRQIGQPASRPQQLRSEAKLYTFSTASGVHNLSVELRGRLHCTLYRNHKAEHSVRVLGRAASSHADA